MTVPLSLTIQKYYQLTKPGIVRGNVLTAAAGFFLAAGQGGQSFDGQSFVAMLCGLALVIAAACVYNNYLDREIDAKMARTRKRALVNRTISVRSALIYATVLVLLGTYILIVWTNLLTAIMALAGLVAYVALYGWAKRRTRYGTILGSLSGAIPPVVGYVAVTNRLDLAAILLFAILLCWQMPHFYAIAIFRLADYKAAGIPVVPDFKGLTYTRHSILRWIAAWILITPLLTVFGYTGIIYCIVVVTAGLFWLGYGLLHAGTSVTWAKSMFGISLITLLIFCLVTSLNGLIP